jgi:hypothetical protein
MQIMPKKELNIINAYSSEGDKNAIHIGNGLLMFKKNPIIKSCVTQRFGI